MPMSFCQSCTMPIDNPSDKGTEKDGSLSNEYCKYCYQKGEYLHPEVTLENMQEFVGKKMGEMKLPEELVQRSLAMLPFLKRWQKTNAG